MLNLKQGENESLRGEIRENEIQIETINEEIQKLNDNIEAMKKDKKVQEMEQERDRIIEEIDDLRKRSVEAEHEYNELKIKLISTEQKTKVTYQAKAE